MLTHLDQALFKRIRTGLCLAALMLLVGCGEAPDQIWQPENEGLITAALSDDLQQVLIGNDKGQANLWQLGKEKSKKAGYLKADLLHQWAHAKQAEGGIRHVALSKNGEFALTADEQSVVWWKVVDGTIAGIWQLPKVESLALSADGRKALFGQRNGIQYFDLAGSRVIHRLAHPDRVRTVALSEDLTLAMSGSDQASARVWNLKTGEMLHEWKFKSKLQLVLFSPDTSLAVVNPALDHIYIYALDSGEQLHALSTRYTTLSDARFTADGKSFVTIQFTRQLDRWSSQSGKHLGRSMPKKPILKADHQTVLALGVTGSGKSGKLLQVNSDGSLEQRAIP